jgi:alanine dehydrogenase
MQMKYQHSLLPQPEMLEVKSTSKKLRIGIPFEQDKNENRIAITPLAVELLVAQGNEVFIEKGAGERSNFSDNDFSEKGGQITDSRPIIFQSDVILKVSPLTPEEIALLKGNQLLISAINIGTGTKEYLLSLMRKRITTVGYELIQDDQKSLPVVRSMSEIIGSTAVLKAAEYLSHSGIGKGKILGGITGVNPSEVVILGSGTAAEHAARIALGLGAVVKVFDHSIYRLGRLQNNIYQRVFTSIIQPTILANAIQTADIIIGALDMMDPASRYIISEDLVMQMKKGSVIIDTSIDQGGCFETSRVTSHQDPIYIEHGIVHYCVPNIASTVARTASYALSNIFAPILSKMGDSASLSSFIKYNYGFRQGVYIYNGILTNNQIGSYFDIPSKDIDLLVAAM